MFRNVPNTELTVELTAHDVVDPSELVALSILELDLEPPSSGGWDANLAGRGIPVVDDDIGRKAIYRADARLLITERRDAEQRQ
jgi:hypothetical protein